MATVPLSGTNIRLLSGVPFHNDYKNSRWFDNVNSQTSYFTSKTVIHSMTDASFQRIEGKHFIAVNKSIDELWSTNYLMFQNTQYNSKWFYAFVTKLEYKNKGTTWVHFQIDVLQTWMFEMKFKPSYVVREHRPLWNADGSPIINTIDEGLSYGNKYETVQVQKYLPYGKVFFMVIVAKKQMHGDKTQQSGTNGVPTPLQYYFHPFTFDGSWLQANNTALPYVTDVLSALYGSTTATDDIVSLYITEYIGCNLNYDSQMSNFTLDNNIFEIVTIDNNFKTIHVKDVIKYEELTKSMGDKYSGYTKVTESKLLMYPYTVTVLSDMKGNQQEIRNEYIKDTDINLVVNGSMGTSNKVSYRVKNYLMDESKGYSESAIANGLINNSANDIPILTEMLAAYLQGNRNSLEVQKQSIMFNGYMNLIGNVVGGVGSALTTNPVGVASSLAGVAQGAGNSRLKMESLQAKQADINNVPPQITKMGSNTAFDYGNNLSGVYIIKQEITDEYRKKLTDYFNMFGYKLNEVKVPNFHTRKYWNYIQTESCIITGNFNNEDLSELCSVFDNGITLWHTDDIGNYSLVNEVIA